MVVPLIGAVIGGGGLTGILNAVVVLSAVNTAMFVSLKDLEDFWWTIDAADVTWATDAKGELVQQFRVYSLGTTIIIDREGHIAYRDDGATPYEVLRAEVEEVL